MQVYFLHISFKFFYYSGVTSKIIVIGDLGVGKTSIINRYIFLFKLLVDIALILLCFVDFWGNSVWFLSNVCQDCEIIKIINQKVFQNARIQLRSSLFK